jgi:hypothetical protein
MICEEVVWASLLVFEITEIKRKHKFFLIRRREGSGITMRH